MPGRGEYSIYYGIDEEAQGAIIYQVGKPGDDPFYRECEMEGEGFL